MKRLLAAMVKREPSWRLAFLLAVVSALTALLASGCLWGVVKDANTGTGVAGATVKYTDSKGISHTTTTNAKGLYAFDVAKGPVPAPGVVGFEVSATGYQPLSMHRLVEYDDNPNADLANLSSFWEVRNFKLVPQGPQPETADLAVTDIYPDILPQGKVYARITNNGPDSLSSVAAELSCEATRTPWFCLPGNPCLPIAMLSVNNISISLDPGQTGSFDTGIVVNTDPFTYSIECTVQASINDPNPANDTYSEPIPAP